jgi:hypothetical protein
MINRLIQFTLLLAVLALLPAAGSIAGTPLPVIHEPHGEGVKCVQPEDEIKRNHMKYILHQRDETMHDGIRTKTYSLAECINCHVEPDKNGHIASIESKDHFCHGCHEYAAVQIDCFECHADRPQKYIKRASEEATIEQGLREVLVAHGAESGVMK